MKNAVVRARIDSELKANAVRVLAACGLEPSDAIRMFLQQVVAHQGIRSTFAAPYEGRRWPNCRY
ncbi:MAG: type II toxin-antitoxin system RelB/DinJ family antitoxin [Proteobacteria bacterium]|nr:type II toxin-antitoxin system RelB/DinJ family antitoxin [Pseudomonadota bacterium]